MFQNIKEICLLDFKVNKKFILGWCISIFSITFLYMILFPSVEDMAQIKMEAMPEELMQFVGMEDFSDMGNFISYYGMIYKLLLVAISIFAVTFGANIIIKEEKNKTIEFLYSQEVSRLEIYLSKFITGYIALIFLLLSAYIATNLCGFINGGDTFNLMDITMLTKFSSITPFVFLSVGCMISGLSGKLSGSSIGSMVIILSYVLGFLSTIVEEKLAWLVYFSPFDLFSPAGNLDINSEFIINMLIYTVLIFTFLGIGAIQYKRRDFSI
ncbi:MAG: ABC transporter permease subunit [Lachnospiraceae bacterium]